MTRIVRHWSTETTPCPMVAPSVDVVWIYSLSYGGGLVSGDLLYVQVEVGVESTTVLTTQASTKVYKARDGLSCE
ncbi:hypothetical protein KP509_09G083200 [Ceratopteris richardii]|uniref:Urease accessory protein D n=1 Tax=Ceratopteris richardii TaxID=49495 RepID=A0A8T2U8K3_CERRI|nr:hypothetical protein KP509_09G083200 [Ceratopteris richardii]